MKVSLQPFLDQVRFMDTIRRHGRRSRLMAVMLPLTALVIVLQYVAPIVALSLLVVPCYLLLVVVPRWAEEDSALQRGHS
jgi:hypothetical protein